jgi:hypothetical protein
MSGTGNKTMKKHVLMKQSSSLAQKNYKQRINLGILSKKPTL